MLVGLTWGFELASESQGATNGTIVAWDLLPFGLIWGVLEGHFGWTPGKRLLNARTVRADGTTAGVGRGLLRAFSFGGCLAVGFSTASLGLAYLAFALLFSRARQSTGWLAEHDRMTGTRVIGLTPA